MGDVVVRENELNEGLFLTEFGGLDQFRIPEERGHVDFDKYIRGFEIFARANGIKGQQKLKDTLLAKGGNQLQDIYFLLPGATVDPASSEDEKPYDECVSLLKKYFEAQTSKTYEKYMLRKVQQGSGEDFQSFLKRIRKQVERCGFKDPARIEEEVVDQVVFGTNSQTLRAELLKSEMRLEEVITKAKLQEGVSNQMKAFEPSFTSVNRLGAKPEIVRQNARRLVKISFCECN